MNELDLANEILGIVSNLDDENDALEYARLYIKAQTEAVKHVSDEYEFNINVVYRIMAEVDSRFDSGVSEDASYKEIYRVKRKKMEEPKRRDSKIR